MQDNKRVLTIIVPSYNSQNYIGRCLKSLERLNEETSVIFVNDGSTDSSLEIISSWALNRENVHIVSKENGGYCSAINKGLDLCETNYVMFLGSDDEVVPEAINKVSAILKINKPDILAFSTIKINDDCIDETNNQTLDPITKYPHQGLFRLSACELVKREKANSQILFTRDTSRCFKMEIIGNTRYFGKTGVSSDGCFSSLVALKAKSFEFINKICYVWHTHSDSVSGRQKTTERIIDEANVWKLFFVKIINEYKECIPHIVSNRIWIYKKVIEQLFKRKEQELANQHILEFKKIIKWLSKRKELPIRYRIAYRFPKISIVFLKLLHRW